MVSKRKTRGSPRMPQGNASANPNRTWQYTDQMGKQGTPDKECPVSARTESNGCPVLLAGVASLSTPWEAARALPVKLRPTWCRTKPLCSSAPTRHTRMATLRNISLKTFFNPGWSTICFMKNEWKQRSGITLQIWKFLNVEITVLSEFRKAGKFPFHKTWHTSALPGFWSQAARVAMAALSLSSGRPRAGALTSVSSL